MEEGHISKSIPPGRLLALTAGGLIVATVAVFGAILPAEFNMDPLGIGKATGLSRLWAPAEVAFDASKAGTGTLAREYDMPWRTDTIEIPLRSGDDRTRGKLLKLHEGDSFEIGSLKGSVVRIGLRRVDLLIGDQPTSVLLGESLFDAMHRTAPLPAQAASGF